MTETRAASPLAGAGAGPRRRRPAGVAVALLLAACAGGPAARGGGAATGGVGQGGTGADVSSNTGAAQGGGATASTASGGTASGGVASGGTAGATLGSGAAPSSGSGAGATLGGGSGGATMASFGGTSDGGSGGSVAGASSGGSGGVSASSLEQAQRAFIDLRFGMFLHFGILTYTGAWSEANLPIDAFNPTKLDPAQWAAAAQSAHMTFGVLTTRHHDGFALWPSQASAFNVGHISWQGGQGDVVRAYVDAFRSRGLKPGLYYSIWDNTEGIGNGPVTSAQLTYIKTQLTELLTNYGPIPILVLDGWSWRMGHRAVAYQEIRELVKSLQPDCLITDHTHLADPWDVDIVNFEEPSGVFAPATNTYAAEQEQKLNATGGNDWFWAPNIGSLLSVSAIVNDHLKRLEPVWTNFLLNCPPNRDGLLDASIVTRLGEVGAAWSPNGARPPLPTQGPALEFPYTPVAASATSGNAANAIDGINDTAKNTLWQSTGALPATLTLDLGVVRPDVGMLACVPRYTNGIAQTQGNITSFGVSTSQDGTNFTAQTSGTWAADGRMKIATFSPVAARYVRLEARTANGAAAIVTEVTVGARRSPQ